MACIVYYYPEQPEWGSALPLHGTAYCDRNGQFGPGMAYPIVVTPFVDRMLSNYHERHLGVLGVERAGSRVAYYTGPVGSQIYSPLTSLIASAGGQAGVKRAFGLDSGAFALAADRDLTTFDPATALASSDDALRREGARIAAANLRATATAAALFVIRGGAAPDPYLLNHFNINYPHLGTLIAANNSLLFEDARMTQILTGLVPAGRYRPDVLSAAAHLIDVYAGAIGPQVADDTTAAQFSLGISGYLEPELAALLQANTAEAAAAVLAVTAPAIVARTAVFRDTLPFPTQSYFPTPNFFAGPSGTPITIRAWGDSPSILTNDLVAQTTGEGTGFLPSPRAQVLSISVPAARTGEISAMLSGDTITVNAVGGFKGITYFDYRVLEAPLGEEGTARVYVLFR